MKRTLTLCAVALALWLGPQTARAEEPLRLSEVLEAVDRTHPKLEGARQKVEAADGKALAARGGFDPKLSLKTKWAPVGYYDTTQIDASIQQATPVWGASVYAGYRFGWGNFPVYKGDLQTRNAGELRAGIDVPIWKGGPIDPRRAKIAQTKAKLRGAGAGVDTARLKLQREAAEAYWAWVAAGRNVAIAEELLELARARQKALDAQVEAGAVEAIKSVDNLRLVLSREAKVVSAERKFSKAAIELSLFLRNDDLEPVRATRKRVPVAFPEPRAVSTDELETDVGDAVERRPEMAEIAAEREAAKVEVRLAKNQRAPDVSVQSYVARDFGDGKADLRPTEWGIGFIFSVPIPLRKARGELKAARAELSGVDAKTRGLRDKVGAEVRKAHVDLMAALRTWRLAEEQVEAAAKLADAERTRFTEGASDLVVVNLRELALADAQTSAVSALADYHRAHADYRVASGRSPLDR